MGHEAEPVVVERQRLARGPASASRCSSQKRSHWRGGRRGSSWGSRRRCRRTGGDGPAPRSASTSSRPARARATRSSGVVAVEVEVHARRSSSAAGHGSPAAGERPRRARARTGTEGGRAEVRRQAKRDRSAGAHRAASSRSPRQLVRGCRARSSCRRGEASSSSAARLDGRGHERRAGHAASRTCASSRSLARSTPRPSRRASSTNASALFALRAK